MQGASQRRGNGDGDAASVDGPRASSVVFGPSAFTASAAMVRPAASARTSLQSSPTTGPSPAHSSNSMPAPLVLPSAPPALSSRPRSRSLGALQNEFRSKQARKANMANRSRTATLAQAQAAAQAQLFGGRARMQAKLSPPVEEENGVASDFQSPPQITRTNVVAQSNSGAYANAGLPPRSGVAGNSGGGMTLPASSLLGKSSPGGLNGSPTGSDLFGNLDASLANVSLSHQVAPLSPSAASLLHFAAAVDLGGRAQSASSSLRRGLQSQSATSSPHAADNDFYPADLLEIGEIGIGTGDLFLLGPSDPAAAGHSSGVHNASFFNNSALVHPEGGLGSGARMGGAVGATGGMNVGEVDEIDLSLVLIKHIHDRSLALEQRLSGKRDHACKHNNSAAASAKPASQIPKIVEEEGTATPPSTTTSSEQKDSASSSGGGGVAAPTSPPQPSSNPSLSPATSPATSPAMSPAMSPSSAGGMDGAGSVQRYAATELALMNRHIEKLIALLYKSKLSQSLRTVQLRRYMREQFLSDLHTRSGTGEDVEITRWIETSALSTLEISEATGAAAAGTLPDDSANFHEHAEDSDDEDRADEDGEDERQLSASPIDLSVSATPRSSRHPSSGELVEGPGGVTTVIVSLTDPAHPPPSSIPFPRTLSSSSSMSSSPSPTPARTASIELGSAAALAAADATAAASASAIAASSIPAPASSPTLPTAPSFPPQHHSPFSPLTANSSSPSPCAPVAGASASPSLPVTQPINAVMIGAMGDRRSATPIIAAEELHISQLIGSSSVKRGPQTPSAPVRRSSTSEPGKLIGAGASPQLLARGRQPTPTIPVSSLSSSQTLPTAGTSSPLLSPATPLQVPLTALALVDAPSSSPARGAPPSSPGLSNNTLNAPSSGSLAPRSLSDKRRDSEHGNKEGGGLSGPSSRRHSRIYFTLSPAVTEALHNVHRWDFDIFEFVDLVPETPLTTMACYLLERWGLFGTFNIDRATFHRFISTIEGGYLNNAYHNKVHAADVVQNVHVLLLGFMHKPTKDSVGALCTSLTPLDVLSSIIAAAIHDYKHTGTTNIFHQNTVSDLAIRYNDVSILENYHVAEAFDLMLRHKECDILAPLSREQRRECRETIIQMVLATDMKNHISMLTDLQATIEQKKANGTWFDVSSRTDRLLLLKNSLHLADVSNPTKPTPICVRWADNIVTEWFSQGDMERSLKLDISPMMDRTRASVEKSQIGFIDFFIKGLVDTWLRVTPQATVMLDYLKANRAYWTARLESAQSAATMQQQQQPQSSSSTSAASTTTAASASSGSSSSVTATLNVSLTAPTAVAADHLSVTPSGSTNNSQHSSPSKK